ncbi:MAG: lysylphosphatidylglycerol synthase transmembrane domain-containing protein [Kofleriaceae bacterium]
MAGPDAARERPGTEGDPEGTGKKSAWSTIFNLAMFVAGGIGLYFMLRTTSWDELRPVLLGVGTYAGIILTLDLTALCFDAAAWHSFMRPEARMVGYPRVLGAWASGRAINVLTPFGALGEPTKITMLLDRAPKARLVSSLVLLNVAVLYFSVIVMIIGIPITLLLVDVPPGIKVTVGIGMAVLVPLMVMLGIAIQRGAISTLVGTLRNTRIISAERAADWKDRLKEVDRHIRELHRHRTSGTRRGIAFVAASKLVTYTSTCVLIYAVGVSLSPALVIAVLSVGVLIQWIASIVPLGLGIADGGNYALYSLLGATGAQGLLVTMLNRARSVCIAILGLGAMVVMTALSRLQQARIQRRIKELKAELRPDAA